MSSSPRPSWLSVITALSVIWVVATKPVQAYLDPGTGSYLFQIAIASLFGILFTVKTFWLQIRTFFLKLFGKSSAVAAKAPEKTNG